jgi:hypothetical protein
MHRSGKENTISIALREASTDSLDLPTADESLRAVVLTGDSDRSDAPPDRPSIRGRDRVGRQDPRRLDARTVT